MITKRSGVTVIWSSAVIDTTVREVYICNLSRGSMDCCVIPIKALMCTKRGLPRKFTPEYDYCLCDSGLPVVSILNPQERWEARPVDTSSKQVNVSTALLLVSKVSAKLYPALVKGV